LLDAAFACSVAAIRAHHGGAVALHDATPLQFRPTRAKLSYAVRHLLL